MNVSRIKRGIGLLVLFFTLINAAEAQTTAFNFQGRLNDGSTPVNGHYDLQFKLFTAIAGGTQVGATIDQPDKVLVNGVFSTALDFGSSAYLGGNRFIEISVRPTGSPNPHVVLGARQQVMSVPFSVRSDRANQADFAGLAQDSFLFAGMPATSFAQLNFTNSGTLKVTGDITTGSNLGVGTGLPATRLSVNGGPSWTSSQWTASMNMQNGSAVGWEANSSGQRFGIGQTNGGLYFFRTTNPFGSTSAPANVDLGITDSGSVTQPAAGNGMVKAMLAVTSNGTIARCYNGVTGSSTGDCGFGVVVQGPPLALFIVGFPFEVSNRFWLVTPERSEAGLYPQTAGVQLEGKFSLIVETHYDGKAVNRPFHLFVF